MMSVGNNLSFLFVTDICDNVGCYKLTRSVSLFINKINQVQTIKQSLTNSMRACTATPWRLG